MKTTAYNPAKRRAGRRRRQGVPSSPAPAGLTLVAALYEDSTWVRLTFDRPIDIGALVGNAIVVDDGAITGVRWEAIGTATLLDPVTVQIELTDFAGSSRSDTVLDATAATGIVVISDGGTWPGVMNLVLPFPA